MVVLTRPVYRGLVATILILILVASTFVGMRIGDRDDSTADATAELESSSGVSVPNSRDSPRTIDVDSKDRFDKDDLNDLTDIETGNWDPSNNRASQDEYTPGEMKWWYRLPQGGMISTPCLTDLNGDNMMEVVFASDHDYVQALDIYGQPYWPQAWNIKPGASGNGIEYMSEAEQYTKLDFVSPPIFSSTVAANVDGSPEPEIFLGVVGGLLALRADGTELWTKTPLISSSGQAVSFSTAAICDIEGDYAGHEYDGTQVPIGRDMEVVFGCDDEKRNAWLSVIAVDSDEVMTFPVGTSGEGGLMGAAIVTAETDGTWEFEEPGQRPPAPGESGYEEIQEKLWMEFETSTHDSGLRMFAFENMIEKPSYAEASPSWLAGHQTYATACVGNFSENFPGVPAKEHEVLVGSIIGAGQEWNQWGGKLYLYDKDGKEYWQVDMSSVCPVKANAPATESLAIIGSPAVADMEVTERSSPGAPVKYETIVCNDAGYVLCFDIDTHNLLWSYRVDVGTKQTRTQRGGAAAIPDNRIMSSPAICNIFSDEQLEVVVGSNNGKVYCFDGDPTDDSRDNPGTTDLGWPLAPSNDNEWDGIAEDPGDGTTENGADVLWVCDTKYDDLEKTTPIMKDGYYGGQGFNISSIVIADIDNDGWLEGVIGDVYGFVYCIVVGPCISGQVDWPEYHYDSNRSGVYKPKVFFGVDLQPEKGDFNPIDGDVDPGERDNMFKRAEPGETVSYNISLQNLLKSNYGEDIDLVWINVSIPPKNWSARLEYQEQYLEESDEGVEPVLTPIYEDPGNPGSEKVDERWMHFRHLRSQEYINLTLYVTAPNDGDVGEIARVNVTANSSLQPWLMDNIETITLLDITLDFDVEYLIDLETDKSSSYFGFKHRMLKPGYETDLPVFIENKGNINDTYLMEIINVPQGWTARFADSDTNQTRVSILAPKFCTEENELQPSVNRMITVGVPDDAQAGMVGAIRVMGTSERSLRDDVAVKVKQDICFIEVGTSDDLLMRVDEPTKEIDPGGEVEYEVFVTNVGTADITQVDYGITGDIGSGWKVDPPTSTTDLRAGDTVIVKVKVKAPVTAMAGSTLAYSLIGTVRDNPNIEGRVSMLVQVKQNFGMTIEVPDEEKNKEGKPGEWITYNVTVTNDGNGQEVLHLDPLDTELEWETHFSSTDEILDAGQGVTFTISVYVPESAMMGDYALGFNLSGLRAYEEIYVKAQVKQFYNIEMDILEEGVYENTALSGGQTATTVKLWGDSDERFISPSDDKSFRVRLQNKGNGVDRIRLTLNKGSNQNYMGWQYYFATVSNSESEVATQGSKNINFVEGTKTNYRPVPISLRLYTTEGTAESVRDSSQLMPKTIDVELLPRQTVYISYKTIAPSLHEENSALSPKYFDPSKDIQFDFYAEAESNGSLAGYFDSQLTGFKVIDRVNCSLHVKLSDLLFSSGLTINTEGDEAVDDDLVTFVAKVKNTGDIDAENVWVYLRIDGEVVEKMRLTIVPARDPRGKIDNTRTVSFTWKAETGKYDVELIIDNIEDDIGSIEEMREDNNYLIEEGFQVKPAWASTEGGAASLFLPLLLWLMRIGAIAALVILLREGKLDKLKKK